MVGLGWLFVLLTIRERINSTNWVDGEANTHIHTHTDTHRHTAPLSTKMPQWQRRHKHRHCPCFPSAASLFPPHDSLLLFHFPHPFLSALSLLDFGWPLSSSFLPPFLSFAFIYLHILYACLVTKYPHFRLVSSCVCLTGFMRILR